MQQTPESDVYFSLKESVKDPTKLIVDIIEAGYSWADADAAASQLEDTKKSLLAQLCLEYEQTLSAVKGGRGVKSEAEMYALADERYTDHVKDTIEARKNANRARVKYDTGKIYIELQRSVLATVRQEMLLSGRTT